MKTRWNVSTPDNAAPRPQLSSRPFELPTPATSRSGDATGAPRIAHSSGDRKHTTTTPNSLGRRMWIVLAIAGLAACSEAAPRTAADTSGAATTTTSVPTLAVASAPCGEAVVPGGVDDFPEGRRVEVACPAACGEAVVPGGVDDVPECRGPAVAREAGDR